MTKPSDDLIDRLGAAALDARKAVSEAHAARKDLRQAVKEAREEIDSVMAESIDRRMSEELGRQLDEAGFRRHAQGMKDSLDKWLKLCAEATEVLEEMRARGGPVRCVGEIDA